MSIRTAAGWACAVLGAGRVPRLAARPQAPIQVRQAAGRESAGLRWREMSMLTILLFHDEACRRDAPVFLWPKVLWKAAGIPPRNRYCPEWKTRKSP
jgi:hypothetical protein